MSDGTEVSGTAGLIEDIRSGVRSLCQRFPDEYWRKLDAQSEYAEEFVRALTEAGWLAILIPEQYGGGGLGLQEAATVLEEINASGGSSAACHAKMYVMAAILRHGSVEQKERYLPEIAAGRLRLQSFGVTEPDAGSDSSRIRTSARRTPDGWVVNGQKIWTSRMQHTDLLLLLARTTPREQVSRKTDGLSLFLVDLRQADGTVDVRPIRTMMNHETNEVFFHDLRLPADALVGEEGAGLRHAFDGMNAERILIAAE